MNTTKNPYVGDAIVIDKAEFARLIRKHRGLHVSVHAKDYDDVAPCQSCCFGITVPVKQALERLQRCDFDAFEWRCDEHGPSLWHYTAPRQLQLRRRRDYVAARIPVTEARIARLRMAADQTDGWRKKMLDSDIRGLATDRGEILRLDAQLAPATSNAA